MTQLACQTITWGPERLSERYPDVVREVANVGYAGVETNLGILSRYSDRLAQLREQHKLRFVAAHGGLNDLRSVVGDRAAIDGLKAVLKNAGVEYLLVSHVPEMDAQVYTQIGNTLATLQNAVGDLGVTVLFHNHQHEIENEWESLKRLCDTAGHRGIGLAVDFGWVLRGRVDLTKFISSMGTYIRYAHFKDFRNGDFVELGQGDIGLERAIQAVKPLNLPWWVAEQDQSKGEPADSAARNYAFLRAFL